MDAETAWLVVRAIHLTFTWPTPRFSRPPAGDNPTLTVQALARCAAAQVREGHAGPKPARIRFGDPL